MSYAAAAAPSGPAGAGGPAAGATPQLFSVDADGTGAGRIVSESGDVYEGSFLHWRRHGWGLQRWSSGELYRGTWVEDAQARGVFTDKQGVRWKGDFRTGQVERVADDAAVDEEVPEDRAAAQPEQKEEQVTHFPASQHAYQAQPAPDFAATMPAPSSSRPAAENLSATHLLTSPRSAHGAGPPPTARSRRFARSGNASPRRPRQQLPRSALETPAEREQRLAREAEEEAIVAKELKAATFALASRYGSSRNPLEATFGLDTDTPGPGAYGVPSVALTKRAVPAPSMSPRLPFTNQSYLDSKAASSQGPWSATLPPADKDPRSTRQQAPRVNIAPPPMLPPYVKESEMFKPVNPGPGAYTPIVSPRGDVVQVSRSRGPVAAIGGFAVRDATKVPIYLGSPKAMRGNLGKLGADAGLYSPNHAALATHPSAPSVTMGGKSRLPLYATLKMGLTPGPGAHSPSLSVVLPDPAAQAPAWGASRSGQRVHPTESTRAVNYMGAKFMRAQMGLEGPGPAAYSPKSGADATRPRVTAAVFTPHVVAPHPLRLAQQMIESKHKFVKQVVEQVAKKRNGGVTPAKAEGAQDGAEAEAPAGES